MILFGLMLAGYAKGKGKDRILVSLKGLQERGIVIVYGRRICV